ncbi:hypothetical protein [Vibrio paucivorans]
MRLSRLRTIWISALSGLALLLSTVASSEPLMTFQMLSAESSSSMTTMSCHSGMKSPMMHHDMKVSESSPTSCGSEMDSTMHHCCLAACINVLAFPKQTLSSFALTYKLALIPLEPHVNAVNVTRSLFRPPIA